MLAAIVSYLRYVFCANRWDYAAASFCDMIPVM
jgi:hypothetical protein